MTSLKTMYFHQMCDFVKGRIKELDKICEKCTRSESYCTGNCKEIQIARKEIRARLIKEQE